MNYDVVYDVVNIIQLSDWNLLSDRASKVTSAADSCLLWPLVYSLLLKRNPFIITAMVNTYDSPRLRSVWKGQTSALFYSFQPNVHTILPLLLAKETLSSQH